ncbi:Transglycosylase SLT domain protein [Acididesulfobacillus acetoxydans]|uniref:Lytic transglycosylase catalytic n=1 Tax=Acididesulfobacillus acetoxydans TaxID=1561005 RepID=A0A8S0XVF8_9FIRM|nr:cell wall-binding repeat-containing protein [Acididesulfobacillus acetoxydans]CAA7600297.1 Transglycosylase SLT domain protein [Acididesulfobacillus acetoxydans]CEJ06073.1 Lytic transglycosylase catalytic [Acididesulfobacillus acetoxydans]
MKKNVNPRKRIKAFWGTLLSLALLLQMLSEPSFALASPAPANFNPPLAVINQKLDTVAREKGIPSVILKAIAFEESSWRQFDSQGNPLLAGPADHPAIGLMQVASYNGSDQATINKLKYDIDFNIEMGADILNQKWEMVPKIGDGDRNKLENWYFALWAYNCWTGKNNPNEALLPAPLPGPVPSSTPPSNPSPSSSSPATSSTSGASSSTSGSSSPSSFSDSSPTPSDSSSAPSGPPSPPPSSQGPTLPVYQDRILNLLAHPPGWLSQYIQPVDVTPVPSSALPQDGIPSASVVWPTPQPFHLGDLGTPAPAPPTRTSLVRIAGSDRVATAVNQALLGWPQGAPAVVLARSDDYPDALAGVPLAAKLDAPILLTAPKGLDKRVQTALKTLHPNTVYLLGGEGALSPQVSTDLTALGWNKTKQVRLGGVNRYATAAIVAQNLMGAEQPHAVALATGENFPDALSIASVAGQQKMPVLLTETSHIPAETLQALRALKPSLIYLIGGSGVISPAVSEEIAAALKPAAVRITRLAGPSRYDTMAAVGNAFGQNIQGLSFATGEDFPNALTGAALAAHMNETLVLVPDSSLDNYPGLKDFIARHLSSCRLRPYLFGNVRALSPQVESELNEMP